MRISYFLASGAVLALFCVAFGSARADPSAAVDDYREARGALVKAYQQGDFSAMRSAADAALQARPGYPGALFNRALAEVLDDDAAASLQTLRKLLSMHVDFGVAAIDDFAPLMKLPGWHDYAAAARRLHDPVGVAEVVVLHEESDFIPEGIARDAEGRLYLGSIRKGKIVRIDEDAETLSTPVNGHWSVFGMRFDEQGGLWFASADIAQFEGHEETGNATGLFCLDRDTRQVSLKALLPASEHPQLLGDLVIGGDGELYATDSLSGAVYAYRRTTNSFEAVAGQGAFGSPQGLVMDASGRYLYIADYIGGLFRITLATGTVEKVTVTANATDYGIDGLYRYGDELIAIQNGVRPHRVVAFKLGDNGRSISRARILAANLPEFDEPTLGLVDGDSFYFVANSHWNRFDADHNVPEGLTGPIVLKLTLSGAPE